jgi:uncharacterized protein YndB with AHSA1/START domain
MSVSRQNGRKGTRGYAHLVEIKAPVARVWRAITDPALVRIWSGADAEIDARQGGVFRMIQPGSGTREAHIDIFDPNRRMRLIYLHNRDAPPCESAVVDDFLLDVRKGEGTASLRLLGSGIPQAEAWDRHYARLRVGWERLLSRIKATLENPPVAKRKAAPPVEAPLPVRDPPLAGFDF